MVVRSILLTVALLPYLYYGTKDNLYHFRGRRVSLVEHVLHLGVGVTVFFAVTLVALVVYGPRWWGMARRRKRAVELTRS